MLLPTLTGKHLKHELNDYRERFPKLVDDQLFVLWFVRAFVTEQEQEAVDALVGGPRDKGVDAVLIDSRTKTVSIVQGKYRQKVSGKNEKRNDVTSFAQLAPDLCGDRSGFGRLCDDISPEVHDRLIEARTCVKRQGYRLQLYYVTTGKCSRGIADEAKQIVRTADCPASIRVFDGPQIIRLLFDYLDGVAPPVPSLDLEMEAGDGVELRGVLQRHDSKTGIESWVFPMTDRAVAGLFAHAGKRLFARNIRGFLGRTQINRGMENTLRKEPAYFWYYNNGITIICDDAEEVRREGKSILRVTNPQVINGQQTTLTLAINNNQAAKASVLVRVIRVPREGDGGPDRFESLVSRIVSATNWQNAIRASDLMSNDRRQIEIERQLRKLGYWYVRKRQTKSEAKRSAGSQRYFFIRKEELARAVAACDFDPLIVREGKEGLFEERWYAQVFPTTDPYYYLNRYWLMRDVTYNARGYPERAYAKWLVLNFMWSCLAPLVRSRADANFWRGIHERKSLPLLRQLDSAINKAFAAALRFYRDRRGKGERALDVSTFFKRKGLHRQFDKFWRRPANKSRSGFNKTWKRFEKALKEERSV